jgi:four helix bundle protein
MKYKYENLEVYTLSRELIKKVYQLSIKFPKSEIYNLSSQTNRAVVSVSLNIAEGSMRQSAKEFKQFIRISIGSLVETDTCLKIAVDLGYLTENDINLVAPLIEKIYFKLFALEKSLHKDNGSTASNKSNSSNVANGAKQ